MSISEHTIWPVAKLATLAAVENGARPIGGVSSVTQGIPSLGGEHLTASGDFDFEHIKYIPLRFFNSLTRGIIQTHDILLVKDGATTGKVAFVGEDFPFEQAAINEHLYRIRPKGSILEPEYLFYFLYSEWGQAQIQQLFQGAAIGGINLGIFEHLEIPIPPSGEQRQLVKMLRLAKDGLHRMNQRAYSKLQEQYASLFYQRFGSGLPSAEYPDTVKLKDLLAVPLASGFSPNTDDVPPGIPVFSLSALTKYGVDESQVKYYPARDYQGRGSDLKVDDILISRSNTQDLVGRVGRYRGRPAPVLYPDLTIRIRLRELEDSPYLENYLRSQYMSAVIESLAHGTSGSMKKINQGEIEEFDILWPPEEVRRSYARQVRQIDQMLEQELLSIAILEQHFQSLLGRSFTGELTRAWREKHNLDVQKVLVPTQEPTIDEAEYEQEPFEELPFQRDRAVRNSLDEKTRHLLDRMEKRYEEGQIYSHPLQLRSGNEDSLVEVEERLTLLASIGFALLTEVGGRRLYRLVKPAKERALLEELLL